MTLSNKMAGPAVVEAKIFLSMPFLLVNRNGGIQRHLIGA